MYQAPDRYKRMISARLPDGESLGVSTDGDDRSSSPLRDTQLIARSKFARAEGREANRQAQEEDRGPREAGHHSEHDLAILA